MCAYGLGRLSVSPDPETRENTGKSLEATNLESATMIHENAVTRDTTREASTTRGEGDRKVSEPSEDTLSSESLETAPSPDITNLTESWSHKSIRLDAVVSCNLPKGSFSATYNDANFTVTILFSNYQGAQRKTGSLSLSVSGLLQKMHIQDQFKSPESFKADWMKNREKEMRGMSAHQLEEYKNRFEKYKFEPIKANDFTGFVWGSVDENRRQIFLTNGKNYLKGSLNDFDGGPMTLELALRIISSVRFSRERDLPIASLSFQSLRPPSDLPIKPIETGPEAETKEEDNDWKQNKPFAESAATPDEMPFDQKTVSSAIPSSSPGFPSKAMQMAQTDPKAFLEMLRKRVLDDLIKERDKESCASIAKYEGFVSKIPDEETRSDAQSMLKELKENYSKTWHLLYPIQLSERWHEIKGNPVARSDFAEMLSMAGVSACRREDVAKAMEPVENLTLFGPVNYLDPLQDAVTKLSNALTYCYKFKSTKITSFNRVESAVFPLDTFYYYSYDVEGPPDSVNRLYFMVDNHMRVVALQEVIESPKTVKLQMHKNKRSVYNFMQMRRKGTGSYKIAYMERSSFELDLIPSRSYSEGGNVCVLASELIDDKGIPREWVRLHLPRRLAEVCLYICKEVDD